jgi:hemerythrin-like domain-containing protein
MTHSLPQVAHEHHERIVKHIDLVPAVADRLLTEDPEDVRASLAELGSFIDGTLIPHVDAAERTLYPELERMFQNRHSMAPMRREHVEVRRLAGEYDKIAARIVGGHLALGEKLALRRVLFQLYALVKVHLAEEEAYLRIVEHGTSTEVADVLAVALEHPIAD